MPPDNESEKSKHDDDSQTRAELWTILEIQPCLKDSRQSDFPNERRRHPRYRLERNCNYRVVNQSGFNSAALRNISESGLAIEVKRTMSLGCSINILIEDETSDSLPWLIRATVVRDAGSGREGFYRYGCEIKFIFNPENYLD